MVTQAPVGSVERDPLRLAAVCYSPAFWLLPLPDSSMQKVQTRMTTKPFSLSMRRASRGRRCISVSSSEW